MMIDQLFPAACQLASPRGEHPALRTRHGSSRFWVTCSGTGQRYITIGVLGALRVVPHAWCAFKRFVRREWKSTRMQCICQCQSQKPFPTEAIGFRPSRATGSVSSVLRWFSFPPIARFDFLISWRKTKKARGQRTRD